MIKIDLSTKLNTVEVVTRLLKCWDTVNSVILFVSLTLRFKATKRKGTNEILITIGRPNYAEREYFKKVRKVTGKAPKFLMK